MRLVVLLLGICWNISWRTVVDTRLMNMVIGIDTVTAVIITITTDIVGVGVIHDTVKKNTRGSDVSIDCQHLYSLARCSIWLLVCLMILCGA